MRIGLDMDDVLYPFAASVQHYLKTAKDGWWPEALAYGDPQTWDFYNEWGLTQKEFDRACHEGVGAGIIFGHGEPFEGTRDAMLSMKEQGHSLHIVTARRFGPPGLAQYLTVQWLHVHGLLALTDSLTFAKDKTIVDVHYLVDDKLGNYDAMVAQGTYATLIDRPWNQDGPNEKPRRRVYNLTEFAERLAA